ncbi:hypothetical protein JQ628_05045 [Bradyrhizobium lablabi]|uniref:hypothetical protein n=1 Tax=Bradyrhizobium lablabi TaxID=722472 RepID=UPI001BAC6E2E|nr:hypothetical protein [Bradyrhizobium lablabi]MBR1120875.1 hypothetical protein [Bradyrhizobium lablabi]
MQLDLVVDLSTKFRMATRPREPDRKTTRQIVGFSLSPEIARAVKAEAAQRGVSLRKLFEELWAEYEKTKPAKARQ